MCYVAHLYDAMLFIDFLIDRTLHLHLLFPGHFPLTQLVTAKVSYNHKNHFYMLESFAKYA